MNKSIIIIGICILLFATFSYAYEVTETKINNKDYYIYQVSKDELPININHHMFDLEYISNEEAHGNADNGLNHYIMFIGEYMKAEKSNFNLTQNQSYNITLELDDDLSIGTYETHLFTYRNRSIWNATYFRILIGYNDTMFLNQSFVFDLNEKEKELHYYTGDLPRSISGKSTIKTQPNETMYIKCTGFFECSTNETKTGNTTSFDYTFHVPDGTKIGQYKSTIYINMSYNKSGNFTWTANILKSDIKKEEIYIIGNKSIENMTVEELNTMLKGLNYAIDRQLNILEVANKTTVVEKNVTESVPYMANKDEIIQALSGYYTDTQSGTTEKLVEQVDRSIEREKQYLNEIQSLKSDYNQMHQRLNSTIESLPNIILEQRKAQQEKEEEIYGKNIVIPRIKFGQWFIIFVVIISTLVGIMFVDYKKSGYWIWQKV